MVKFSNNCQVWLKNVRFIDGGELNFGVLADEFIIKIEIQIIKFPLKI